MTYQGQAVKRPALDMDRYFAEFDRIIQANKYSKHSFVKEIEAGRVSREQMKRWAIQKYHQVYLQNSCYSGIHANTLYEDVRRFEISQLLAEETGIQDGSDTHYNLMKRFAIAMGASEEEVTGAKVHPQVWDFVNYLNGICRNNHFVYGLLAIYVNESQTSESAIKMQDALAQQFGLDDHALEWFHVHGRADIEHSEEGKALVMKYAHEAPNFEWRSYQVVETGSRMWTRLHDYYASIIQS